ncbi:S1C family serine protease [Agaribacterium haliotis]|uniref:S1C family serine protease n=1 Tax=Agaribacterium haliotis TaxID=2013869 RepID=UPI000BB57794|nr:trypsin-like peptidase domain-containing protein [Agaribacterium haliotis]
MHLLTSFYRFARGPALAGLVIAALLSLLYPQYFSGDEGSPAVSSYADAVDKASASVVNIYTLRSSPANQGRYNPVTGRFVGPEKSQVTPSTGSGVIVSGDGYIVTALHVIEWAREIRVALQDGREAIPEIIGVSEEDDVAILKIELDQLQAIELGQAENVRVGDIALAIGNPFGVGQTVTQGIISATRRNGLNIARFENYLQTDAAINPGNSGGALVDVYGRLLGINIGDLRHTSLGDASGIGFAIPADRAVKALNDIVEHGRVVRGWIGVSALNVTPRIIKALNLSVDDGVLITDTYQGGPADIAGVIPGDVVVAINGHAVNSMEDAIGEFADLRPNDVIQLDLARANKRMQLEVLLGTAPTR